MNTIKAFLAVIAITLIMPAPLTSANTKYIAEYLSQAQFTTRVNSRVPVDNITRLGSNFKKVYFFTDIRECEDCDIEHQWWYRGKKVSVVEGETTSARYRWWTSKNLTGRLGDWTVKVIVDDDEVYSKTFTYYKRTQKQIQTTPLMQRVTVKEADDCEIQLRYFSDKVITSPEDPYFKFMLKKWGKRCSGE